MEILQGFADAVVGIFEGSGLSTLNWQNYVMIGISIVLLYLAIKKQYEPLLLLPIAFGMLLVNLYPSIMAPPTTQLLTEAQCAAQNVAVSGHAKTVIDGVTYIENPTYGGLLYYLYQGVKLGIYPPLIFLGIGCTYSCTEEDCDNIHKLVLSCFAESFNNAGLLKEVTEHKHTNERSCVGKEDCDDNNNNYREHNLLKL